MRRNQLPPDGSPLSPWAPEPFSLDAVIPALLTHLLAVPDNDHYGPPHSLRHSMTLQTPTWAVLKGKRISSPQRKQNSLLEEKKELPANMLPDLHITDRITNHSYKWLQTSDRQYYSLVVQKPWG